MDELRKVSSFRDLLVWQKSVELCLQIYKLCREFPKKELFGLTSQLQRAAVSVSSNIAEGSGRGTTRDLIRFLQIAKGSLCEMETQLLIARKLQYGSPDLLLSCDELAVAVAQLPFGLLRSLEAKLHGPTSPRSHVATQPLA